MWAKLTRHWFLTALVICFAVGYLASDYLKPLYGMTLLRSGVVFVVMWMMGVTLHADSIRKSLRRPLPSVLAIAINVALVPLLCLPTRLFLPATYFGGLFITAIVPCTLASASVWTRKAGGDDSIAMMTTVVTNLACVVVVPVGILFVLAHQTQIDAAEQFQKLAVLVVLPLVLAQVMRRAGVAGWADRNKVRISTFSQFGILMMVIFGAVASAAMVDQADAKANSWQTLTLLVVAAAAVHTVALYLGVMSSRLMKMERSSQIAVGIAGSQKTLMVGLQIAIDCGVSVIPMLIYQLCQLFIDTVVADRWKRASTGDDEEAEMLL